MKVAGGSAVDPLVVLLSQWSQAKLRVSRVVTGIVLIAAQLAAQQTRWTVNTFGGGDFASLQAAIDAASPGDTVFIEAPFAGFPIEDPVIVNKGIHIESRLAWLYFGTIRFSGVPRGQTASAGFMQEVNFECVDCEGRVQIGAMGGFFNTLDVRNCRDVVYTSPCNNVTISDSNVRMQGVIQARVEGGPSLTIRNSVVEIMEPFFISASATVEVPTPADLYLIPAIDMQDSFLAVYGRDTEILSGRTRVPFGGPTLEGPSILARGSCEVVLSESVQLRSDVLGVAVRRVPDPVILAGGVTRAASPSDPVSSFFTVFGDPGDAYVLAASPYTPPVETVFGDLWLNPDVIVTAWMGTVEPDGEGFARADFSEFLIPGQIVNFQCAVLKTDGTLELSTADPAIAFDFRTYP